MKNTVTLLLAAVGLLAPCWAQSNRGWWPQESSVSRDDAAGILKIETRYYTFEHNLKKGGALSKIRLTHGRSPNLLVQPIESTVRLAIPRETNAPARGFGPRLDDIFSDLNSPTADVTVDRASGANTVVVQASLVNPKGKDSGIKVKTTYSYRWGYVKIHKEFLFPGNTPGVRNLCVLNTVLDPSLEDYGHRPAIAEEFGASPFPWQVGQIRNWGKIRAGTHFDLPFQTRYVPRYAVMANHGVEGIEWFMTSDLAQWDYQVTGQPGTGYFELRPSTKPLGVAMSVYPMNLSSSFDLPRGGSIAPRASYAFDYYIGVPILEGHANRPWLNRSYAVNRGKWVTEEQVRENAQDGIVTMHLHNDGDANRDGMFWRDGSYPPYPPEEMKKMDAVIEYCHKYGIKTVPYFSNHELHQSTDVFKKHGEEWGRKPDDQGNLRPNYYYGAHMCMKSGWLDFLKFSIDRVLKNHKFDGVYYDWNIALYCNNPLHVGKTANGVQADKGLGAYAISPTGHWDIDELIDLCEWTRKRVGPDGVFIIHNTLVPMFATENFANYVVGMEFSYGKISVSMPKPPELPLEWNFGGARSRTVIGYGTLASDAPERLKKALAVTTVMTSVAPWPAPKEATDLYKVLQPLGNIEQYRFEDWRNKAVRLDNNCCSSAVYSRNGEAWVLVANFEAEAREVGVRIDPKLLPYPISSLASVDRMDAKAAMDPQRLTSGGERLIVPADSIALIRIH